MSRKENPKRTSSTDSSNDGTSNKRHSKSCSKSKPSIDDSLQVVLWVDRHEWNQSASLHAFQRALDRANILYEQRQLIVADMLWIVKYKSEKLILPFLIERKTAPDLARSLTEPSKRYPPLLRVDIQMYKMMASEIPNKIYLVQGTCNDSATHYLDALRRKDNFEVIQTRDLQETIDFIIQQHGIVQEYAKRHPAPSTSLSYFDLEEKVEDALIDPTFQWKLRLQSVKGIGKLEAIAIAREFDSENAFNKSIRYEGRKQVKETLICIEIKKGYFIGDSTAERLLTKFAPPRG